MLPVSTGIQLLKTRKCPTALRRRILQYWNRKHVINIIICSACLICKPGYYCPVATTPGPIVETLCPSGTYSAAGKTSCTLCPAGSYCHNPELAPVACGTGEYSEAGAVDCLTCPNGYSCPAKDSKPIPCAAGTYSIAGQTACINCPAGYDCETTTKAPTKLCPEGSYSLEGQARCTVIIFYK